MSTDRKRPRNIIGRVAFVRIADRRRGSRSVAETDQCARKHNGNTFETS